MALNQTLRPGLIQLRVLDLDKTLDFYKNILGLDEVTAHGGRPRLPEGLDDEFDHHSVTLRKADEAGLDSVAFKWFPKRRSSAWQKKPKLLAIRSPKYPQLRSAGLWSSLPLHHFDRSCFELYATVVLAPKHPGLLNPDIWEEQPRRHGVIRLDHFLLYGPNIAEAERYCTEVLKMYVPKFAISRWQRLAAWSPAITSRTISRLSSTPSPVKYTRGFPAAGLEPSWAVADLIAINRMKKGYRAYAAMRSPPVKPSIVWNPPATVSRFMRVAYTASRKSAARLAVDHLGRGLFYYEGEMIPSFLEIVTDFLRCDLSDVIIEYPILHQSLCQRTDGCMHTRLFL
jgi:catechol 2,3-dioxygenase